MTNQPNNAAVPTAAEALAATELYPPEVFGVLIGQLEDAGKLDTAAKVIRKQIELSKQAKEDATSHSNELRSHIAYGRRQVIEAETQLKQAQDQQAAREKEQTDLGYTVTYETKRQTALTARLTQIEES